MNYEIQFSRRTRVWLFWSVTDHKIGNRKAHISMLRECYHDCKFRLVRVTRKVVKG